MMKKFITFALVLAMVAAMFVPMTASAANGDLLFKVNWVADKANFKTVDYWKGTTVKYEEKYDISKSTDDMIVSSASSGDDDGQLCYFEETGYKIAADKNYTIYFEAASPHHTKYAGIVIAREASDFDPTTDAKSGNDSIPVHKRIVLVSGHFSDEGDTKDANGKRWTECFFAYDRNSCDDCLLGTGYDEDHRLTSHPQRFYLDLPAGFEDGCTDGRANDENATDTQPAGTFFTKWKIEYKGLDVSAWYLNDANEWVKADSNGNAVTYTAEAGSDIVLGISCRDGYARHLYCNNLKLLSGVGLTYDQIQNAQPAAEGPETPALEVVDTPVAGTAYKFGFYQKLVDKTLYFAGAMNGNYLATTEDASAATDVYLEKSGDGYRLYFMKDGVKNYIDIYEYKTGKAGVQLTTTPTCVYSYNTDAKTLFANVASDDRYMGTYKEYTTISVSATSYITGNNAANIGVTQFPAVFYAEPAPAAETGDNVVYFMVAGAVALVAAIGAVVVIKRRRFE